MILKDYIKKHPGEMVKIGMKSGFWYMGRLGKLDDKFATNVDEQLKAESEKRKKKDEKQMKVMRKLLKEHFENEKMHDDTTLRNLCDQYVVASDGAVDERVYLTKYTPLMEREIVAQYREVVSNEKYIWNFLILEGSETCKYYLYNEWLKDNDERK